MSDFIEPDSPNGGSQHDAKNVNNGNFPDPGNMSSIDISNPFENEIIPDSMSTSGRGTLDESTLETLKRDINDINTTLKKVVYPHFPSRQLLASSATEATEREQRQSTASSSAEDISANCDLWAPLMFVITYSLCVSHAKALFSSLFVLCWTLLLIMSLHMRLTKPYENVNLITYISLSGYCIFPQVINAILTQIIYPILFKLGENKHWGIRILTLFKLITLVLCLLWSLTSISIVTNSRGFIQIFPIGLCLLGLSWLATIL